MKSIILIDDKSTIGKVVEAYLKNDYNLIAFTNPLSALSWLQNGNLPDLIITDIRMSDMTGVELLHYLKNNLMFKDIPVIILSSEDSTSERIRLLDDGAVDYIVKPFNPLELKVIIKKVIG